MSTKSLILVCALLPGLAPGAETIVFEGVHLVPMDREVLLEDSTVVVSDGRITAMGMAGSVAIPPESRRVEARGRFLLPGLVEMHVHLRERDTLNLYLAHGFTTVRDMNGRLGDTLTWREEVESGAIAGPTIIAAGITLYAGASDDHPYPVDTPEQARRVVREMAALGYDLIKIYRLKREPFFALMDEARKLSLPVAGHHPDVIHDQDYDVPLDLTTEEVLASGIVSLEHINELITASLRMKLDRAALLPLARDLRGHAVAVTTLLGQDVLVQQIRREGQDFLTEQRERDLRASFGEQGVRTLRERITFIANELPQDIVDLGAAIPEFSFLMLRTFHQAGVDLLIGTDSHSPFVVAGHSGLDEMDLFVKAGLRPYAALRAATVNAAKVLGKRDTLGTLALGKQADLLLVDGNPLESLAPLRQPLGVMVRGRYYDRSELDEMGRPKTP